MKNGETLDGQQSTQFEEMDIDFRVKKLSHAVVKETENFRVQKLVKKIESRKALQADLQWNKIYNRFSKNSNTMSRDVRNVEFFELCETTPKVQCFCSPPVWTRHFLVLDSSTLIPEVPSQLCPQQWGPG